MKRAAFLDRDGVINKDNGYVYKWQNFQLMPNVIDALIKLNDLGFLIVVVTNQSGIGRGYYSEEDFQSLMNSFLSFCSEFSINIHYFYCPHAPFNSSSSCNCRKPKPGMFFRAKAKLNINLAASIMIGDRKSDMEAAQAAGVTKRFLVGSTLPRSNMPESLVTDHFDSLWDCVVSLSSAVKI